MDVFNFKNIFSTVINFGLGFYAGYSKGGSDARRECVAVINENLKIITASIESDPYVVDSPNETLFHLCNDGNESYLKYSNLCSSNNTFYCKLQDKPLVDVSLPNTLGITPESLEF